MSGARAHAKRKNAQASTGPKTAEGKRRSSGNARRHGLTAALVEEGEVGTKINSLATAFLGMTPRTEVSWCLALEAARAQHALDLIRLRRNLLMTEAEANPANFTGPRWRSESKIMRAAVKSGYPGAAELAVKLLRGIFSRLMLEAPLDPRRRRAEVFTSVASELGKLDRYELRAAGRRRSAIFALDLYRADVAAE